MKKYFLVFLIAIGFLNPGISQAQESLNSMRQRPSYQKLYKACSADLANFKFNLYNQVYTDSLLNTLKIATFSPTAITTTVNTHGVSPYLDSLLQNDSTIAAFNDCFPTEQAHHAFIAKLLVASSLGEMVGISTSVISLKFFSGFLLKGFFYVRAFSPLLAKAVNFATLAIGTAFVTKQIQADHKNSSSNADYDKAVKKIEGTSHSIALIAQEQIKLITEKLNDPNLTTSEIQEYEKDLQEWKIVSGAF